MQLVTGDPMWPLDPDPAEIDIDVIAHALARQCRYGGHVTVEHYSVAEHCYLMSHAIPQPYALAALMHDAAEAYLQDVVKPIKDNLPTYEGIEDRLLETIFQKYGLPYPLPDAVKEYDRRICADEKAQVLAPSVIPWGEDLVPLGVTIQAWPPSIAKSMFLMRFYELTNDKHNH